MIEQQKALIIKLEKGKGNIKPEEKAKIMKLLKELSSSIDRTKEDIKTSLSVSGLKNRTKTEVQSIIMKAYDWQPSSFLPESSYQNLKIHKK